jgi:hypothetical protein
MTRIALAVVGAMLPGAATASAQGVRYGVGGGLLLPGRGNTRIFLKSKVINVTVNGVDLVSVPIRIGLRFGAK